MKNLYHLLVTSYKLRVKLPRFCFAKSPLQNLKGINCSGVARNAPTHIISSSHHVGSLRATTLLILILLLPFFALAQNEATITNLDFSCPEGIVTATYNLVVCSSVDSVTLYYSPDKCEWFTAKTEKDVQPGNGKTIVWNDALDHASFGKFYYKVEYFFNSNAPTCIQLGGVMINGKCWAKYNLNEIGDIYENHAYSAGNYSAALYQWGRGADGHAARNSVTTTTLSPTDDPGHDNFILNLDQPSDWLTTRNDFLWNSGTETCPVKTDYDPCPDGWRVPTQTELETLGVPFANQTDVTKEWKTNYEVSGVNGYLCTDNSSGNSLFLPAAGYRQGNNSAGPINSPGSAGYYRSSRPSSTMACYLIFYNTPSSYFSINTNLGRSFGMSVRCVAEK